MKKSIQKTIETASSRQTHRVARQFVKELLAEFSERNGALLVALAGELGSGKTTFVQGFARGLGIREKVLSPTFVIIRSYGIPHTSYAVRTLWHIDCYRLEAGKELKELGWDNIVSDPHNIVLIEWPERIQALLPKNTLSLTFLAQGRNKRQICVTMELCRGKRPFSLSTRTL